MNSLTWDDLFIDASQLDFAALLEEWPGSVRGQFRPIGASVFGDLFFERRSGDVIKLDVIEGGVKQVADSIQQFSEFMNTVEWQELHLLSRGVALLKDRGSARAPGQFFAFIPHPAFTGAIEWAKVMPLDAVVWNAICAQTLGVAPTRD